MPTDYKKSFKKARNALYKTNWSGWNSDIEVPKSPKKPPTPKNIRAGGPSSDPLKTTTSSEVFESEGGIYVVFKGINGMYYAMYISAKTNKAKDLGEHGSRKEAVDSVLTHHDKVEGGLGEIRQTV